MGVSRFIEKLFGGETGRNEALLRAYGKLPIYAEYRRLELAPGTPTAFSQWMDAGRLAWVRSPTRSEGGTTRSTRLLIGLPGSREAIVASVWDSRDSLGRVFPFAFFVVCPPEALGADAVERWAAAADVHRSFERLYAQLHALGSGGDFYRLYGKRRIALRPDDLSERVRRLRAEVAGIPAEAWFRGLALDSDVSAGAWFHGLLRRVERWRALGGADADLALSCPLSRGYSYETQTVLWLEWLAGLFPNLGRAAWLVVPMETDRTAPTVHWVLRDLLPDDYQLLTTDDRRYGYVEHLSALPAGESGTPAAEFETPRGSVLDWLKQHLG